MVKGKSGNDTTCDICKSFIPSGSIVWIKGREGLICDNCKNKRKK
jgi:hypothetical protein